MTRIAIVQTNPEFGNVAFNVDQAVGLISSVEADLYVLPELFNTGYNFTDRKEVEKLSEPPDGYTFRAMTGAAAQMNARIVYGFAERSDAIYNSAALVGPGGIVGLYRKVHLYYRETLYFAPGNLGFPVYDLPFGRVGIMICFDWYYPESARSLALKNAQLIAHPSNLVLPHCPDAMITRCLENRVFAATVNRVGTEKRGGSDLTYIGTSEIVAPTGEILIRMGQAELGIRVVEVDLKTALKKKINRYNDLMAGRRPGEYGW
ncbi:MAG TPA: nitrilase-related carbon-nitrogen hydrolase [Bacteroidota bacterium]|nr:nitrilase-related carbon-nitrogen hydrolase [Bacteroidota bacterium]